MIKELAALITAAIGAIAAITALLSGRSDPVYIVCGAAFITAALLGFGIRRWSKIPQEQKGGIESTVILLPEEIKAELAKKANERVKMNRLLALLPAAIVLLVVAYMLLFRSRFIFRPVDVQYFETVGGHEAFDLKKPKLYWYYPCENLWDTLDSGQTTLQLLYNQGHGAAFQLVKRPSVAHVMVNRILVTVANIEEAPSVYIPFGGAQIHLPYVLIADIPPDARAGTTSPATLVSRCSSHCLRSSNPSPSRKARLTQRVVQ